MASEHSFFNQSDNNNNSSSNNNWGLEASVGPKMHFLSPFNKAASSSNDSHYYLNEEDFMGLLPFPTDLSSEMAGAQYPSFLDMPSSSSSCYITNDYGFNMPDFSNDIPSELGFAGTAEVLTELEKLDGLMCSPDDMSMMSFTMAAEQLEGEQHPVLDMGLYNANSMNEGYDDMLATNGDQNFALTLDQIDLEGINKWLAWDDELNQELTNEEALAASTLPSQLNLMTQENINFDDGVLIPSLSPQSLGIPNGTANAAYALPFGKSGTLEVVPLRRVKRSWKGQNLKRSRTIFAFEANFQIPDAVAGTVQRVDNNKAIALQEELVGRANVKTKRRRHHFPLAERLHGWTIEFRRRLDGVETPEKFYRHNKSNRMFRSVVEVENFILYDLYPSGK